MSGTRRRLLRALPAAALLAACGRGDPERELRATIAKMARAIETHDPGDFLDHLADDFTRDSGAFGKLEAKRLLAGVMLRNEKIGVTAVVTRVEIEGDRARATLRVLATGGRGGLLPERGQSWQFESSWRREGGAWKVFNAEWREGV
jgi:ketosteroid isomerase-like protein